MPRQSHASAHCTTATNAIATESGEASSPARLQITSSDDGSFVRTLGTTERWREQSGRCISESDCGKVFCSFSPLYDRKMPRSSQPVYSFLLSRCTFLVLEACVFLWEAESHFIEFPRPAVSGERFESFSLSFHACKTDESSFVTWRTLMISPRSGFSDWASRHCSVKWKLEPWNGHTCYGPRLGVTYIIIFQSVAVKGSL